MHPEAERRAACCELVSEVARHAGEVCLKLNGTSMLPAMWPGDVVTVRRCQLADLRPGQVALCRVEGNLVAHRVVRTFPDLLITRGDSVPHCDPPVEPPSVVGYVASIVRNHRRIEIKRTWRNRALSAVLRRSHLCLRITLRLSALGTRTRPTAILAPSEML
jgi:signal peptidase I